METSQSPSGGPNHWQGIDEGLFQVPLIVVPLTIALFMLAPPHSTYNVTATDGANLNSVPFPPSCMGARCKDFGAIVGKHDRAQGAELQERSQLPPCKMEEGAAHRLKSASGMHKDLLLSLLYVAW